MFKNHILRFKKLARKLQNAKVKISIFKNIRVFFANYQISFCGRKDNDSDPTKCGSQNFVIQKRAVFFANYHNRFCGRINNDSGPNLT